MQKPPLKKRGLYLNRMIALDCGLTQAQDGISVVKA